MFAVKDKQDGRAPRDFFRTREEAEAHIAGCTSHSRGPNGEEVVTPGSEYLIIEEVDRASRPCVFCGTEVQSDNAETDFCRGCYYSGRFHEERTCADLFNALFDMDAVTSTEVMHTGGGCFNAGIQLADGRFLTPSIGERSEESGEVWPDAGFPEDENDRWCLVIHPNRDAFWEAEDFTAEVDDALYTTDELVARIAALTEGGSR